MGKNTTEAKNAPEKSSSIDENVKLPSGKSERPRPKVWGSVFALLSAVFGIFGVFYANYMSQITEYVVKNAPPGY